MAKNPTKAQEKSLKIEEAKTKAIEKQITAYEKMLDNGIRLTKEQRKHLRTLKLTADKVSSTSDVYKDISKDMSGMIKKEHTLKFSIKDRFGMGRGLAKLGVQQLQVMRERVAAGEVGNDLAEDLLDTTNNILSGVFFLTGGPNIIFTDPRAQAATIDPVKEHTVDNCNNVEYQALPKRMIIFPAWLQHWVPVNKMNVPRVSISWNVMLEGRVGGDLQSSDWHDIHDSFK